MTALMLASRNGHTKIVQLLLDRGANIEAKDKYFFYTALMHAISHPETFQLLLLEPKRKLFEARK